MFDEWGSWVDDKSKLSIWEGKIVKLELCKATPVNVGSWVGLRS